MNLKHLEKRIADDKFSSDAALAEIKEKSLGFAVTVCTKTVYNMIEEIFIGLLIRIYRLSGINRNERIKRSVK